MIITVFQNFEPRANKPRKRSTLRDKIQFLLDVGMKKHFVHIAREYALIELQNFMSCHEALSDKEFTSVFYEWCFSPNCEWNQ